ncbi:hypothetical protein JZ751_002897 [Albula glossodonta]|uniref:Uncharacterized protein n=1 Tax=Albula glossodonta TaxID=121402 RepID=A0A8T2NB49_9TELE|nr:hypothetical protein JZ751_002897 [Albula glossodonta]
MQSLSLIKEAPVRIPEAVWEDSQHVGPPEEAACAACGIVGNVRVPLHPHWNGGQGEEGNGRGRGGEGLLGWQPNLAFCNQGMIADSMQLPAPLPAASRLEGAQLSPMTSKMHRPIVSVKRIESLSQMQCCRALAAFLSVLLLSLSALLLTAWKRGVRYQGWEESGLSRLSPSPGAVGQTQPLWVLDLPASQGIPQRVEVCWGAILSLSPPLPTPPHTKSPSTLRTQSAFLADGPAFDPRSPPATVGEWQLLAISYPLSCSLSICTVGWTVSFKPALAYPCPAHGQNVFSRNSHECQERHPAWLSRHCCTLCRALLVQHGLLWPNCRMSVHSPKHTPTDVMFRKKDQKDAELDKKIEALRKKNEALMKRYQEVEEDKKRAEEEGMALQSRKGKAEDLTITINKSTHETRVVTKKPGSGDSANRVQEPQQSDGSPFGMGRGKRRQLLGKRIVSEKRGQSHPSSPGGMKDLTEEEEDFEQGGRGRHPQPSKSDSRSQHKSCRAGGGVGGGDEVRAWNCGAAAELSLLFPEHAYSELSLPAWLQATERALFTPESMPSPRNSCLRQQQHRVTANTPSPSLPKEPLPALSADT